MNKYVISDPHFGIGTSREPLDLQHNALEVYSGKWCSKSVPDWNCLMIFVAVFLSISVVGPVSSCQGNDEQTPRNNYTDTQLWLTYGMLRLLSIGGSHRFVAVQIGQTLGVF